MPVSGGRRRSLLTAGGLTAALLVGSTGPTTAAGPRPADPLQQRVDAVHRTGVVGVFAEVTSARSDDRARAGTARLGGDQPMPTNGRFRIGSATKPFTATVVLQLVGEGRLSLEDTVERWLPGVVRGHGNNGHRITVRQLLQHTSGVPEVAPDLPALHSAAGYRAERLRTHSPEELVRLAMRRRPTSAPGQRWSYSNTNYVLAAMVVERVTGRSWAREVQDRIIRPLGLEDTRVPNTFPLVTGVHADSYTAFSAGADGDATDVTVLNPSLAVGSGSITSTAHDLNRFLTALLDGRLLGPAQLAEMTTTTPAPELGVRYGLGLGEIPLSCGGSYYGHFGELLGYRTWVGTTRDGARSATVYVTSDGGPDTQGAMSALVDGELCRADG